MQRLTVILPGLRPATAVEQPPPDFARLLARADWSGSASLLETLFTACGLACTTPPPVARLCAAHDLGAAAAEQALLRADPVHLKADPRLVLLLAPAADEIGADEAEGLQQALAAELPLSAWRPGRCPTRGYLLAPEAGCGSPLGPAWLHGRSVTPFLPRDSRGFLQLFNDLQMVLHAAPPNLAREARGEAPFNALWLWGGGTIEHLPRPAAPALLVGNDVLLAGAASLASLAWQSGLAPGALFTGLHDEALLWVGAPWGAAVPAQPVLDIATFMREWCPALWRALATGALQELVLVGEGVTGRLRPGARWRVWRRRVMHAVGDAHALEDGR